MFNRKAAFLSRVMDTVPDGVYVVGRDRKILYWSKGAAAITGYSPEEMKGRDCSSSLLRHEDEEGISPCAAGCPVVSGEHTGPVRRNVFLRKKDGSRLLVEEHISLPADGCPEVVVVFRDASLFRELRPFQLRVHGMERLVPVCGWCKKIRKDTDAWEQIEAFLTREGFGDFTHTMCPVCAEKIFSKRIYLESYQNVCKAISKSLSLDEVLKLIVTNAVKVMNVKASLLRLLNKETNQLELAAYHGLSGTYVNKGPVDYDASIDDALAGKPASVYDITADPRAKYRSEAEQEGIRSIISIPLRSTDEVIGVLRMYTAEPVEYSDEDLQFAAAIAEQAAIAIVNARHFERSVSREREYLNVFQEVTRAVSSTLDVNEVLQMIVTKLPEVMHLKAATIRLLDESGRKLQLVAAQGLSQRYLNRGPVDTEENVIEALNEKPVAIPDVSSDPRIKYQKESAEEGIKSMLTLPIIARGRVIGVLRLLTGRPRQFSEGEISFTVALAEQCGIAIDNARMYERLKR
ncbi:MAG: GAF domain-containing protein [Nitrospiraceae bacterium]|nr:GAF domain-containing protein [Nitrospiraceae bacterium]